MNTVTIEGKKYPYIFGMAVLKKFAEYKKLKSVNKSILAITGINVNDPSPQNMDDLGTFFLLSFQRAAAKQDKEIMLSLDDMIDWIYSGTDDLQKLFDSFTDSLGSGEGKKSGKVRA